MSVRGGILLLRGKRKREPLCGVPVSNLEAIGLCFGLSHLVHQCAAFYDVFVGDVAFGVWLAVQRDAFYILMLFR